MATPRRRSSRINGGGNLYRSNGTPLQNKLSSLMERDESPPAGARPNIDALMSSPVARPYPPPEEMHPSKFQRSTARSPASRQHASNINSQMPTTQAATPPRSSMGTATENTPKRLRASLPKHMTSPSFDFSFERPESDLSLEAQKIMDSVREEAAKIKAQMIQERGKQEHSDGITEQLYGVGGREIKKPKGKSGRYSEVHKQEFRKMDSIAGHASVWKNKVQGSPLKRSPSKAGLDEVPKNQLCQSKSFKSLRMNESSERLENTAPGKRLKTSCHEDVSSQRPVSRDASSEQASHQATLAKPRPVSDLPSAVTTPTKASLARSVSVKSMKTSMIPSLSRSASTKTLKSPAAPRTEGSNKYLASLARFGNMKSILNRAQTKVSSDPMEMATGTHLPLPQKKLDLAKDLPSLPGNLLTSSPQRSATTKESGFATPNTKSLHDVAIDSPSPSKISTSHTQSQPEISNSPPISSDNVSYPNLINTPNITTRPKLPRASTPGDFTFRAEKTINFTNSPPKRPVAKTSPGSTIRHVRPSGVPTHVPSFDVLPAIPHGMSNKKRSRAPSDTEASDTENLDPMATETEPESDQDQKPRAAKKQRISTSSPSKPLEVQQSPLKRRLMTPGGSRIPKLGPGREKGRRGISLGRLNVLARPKERR